MYTDTTKKHAMFCTKHWHACFLSAIREHSLSSRLLLIPPKSLQFCVFRGCLGCLCGAGNWISTFYVMCLGTLLIVFVNKLHPGCIGLVQILLAQKVSKIYNEVKTFQTKYIRYRFQHPFISFGKHPGHSLHTEKNWFIMD